MLDLFCVISYPLNPLLARVGVFLLYKKQKA